jgi:thiamine biosynthesis lipoprotein
MEAEERTFRAMGCDVHLIVCGGAADLIETAVRRIDDLEHKWSRFIDDSEVNQLNRAAGTALPVSPETVLLVQRAIEAWRLTGGSFDPTLLGAVIRAGYDRSFETLGPTPPSGYSPLGPGAADIEVDGRTVRLPAGTGVDPGGIGKGLAADMMCDETLAAGADGVCINLGGDLRVGGAGPDGGTWTVGVEHPEVAEPIALLGMANGAVATSTTLRRAWVTDGERRHHLIDPQTGRPSTTDVALACVVAGQAWMAETLAKAVLLAGAEHAFDIVGGTGAEALAVDTDGRVSSTVGLRHYLGDQILPAVIPTGGR